MSATDGKLARLLLAAALLAACWPSTGCKTTHAKGDFYSHQYQAALAECRQTVANYPTGKDYAYHRLFLASVAFAAGNYSEANQSLREAAKVMERYGEDGDREVMALVGSERGKVYKGDPFEKMMAHFYIGVTFYFLGDYDKALAGFKNALSSDEMSPDERYKRDCALLHFMAAKACLRAGRTENAPMFLRLAAEASPNNPLLTLDAVKSGNLTLIVESGRGPEKIASGPGDSVETLRERKTPEKAVEVLLDGRPVGRAQLMADLLFQAQTGGESAASSLRQAKGVASELTMGVPLVQSRADTRCWTFLPGKVFVWSGAVPPGMHTITLKFFDDQEQELPEYQQTWYYCPVEQDSLYCFRSGVNKTVAADGGAKPLLPPAMQYDVWQHCQHKGEHAWCNNMCNGGPHVSLGGNCSSCPTPGTQNYEDIIFAKK